MYTLLRINPAGRIRVIAKFSNLTDAESAFTAAVPSCVDGILAIRLGQKTLAMHCVKPTGESATHTTQLKRTSKPKTERLPSTPLSVTSRGRRGIPAPRQPIVIPKRLRKPDDPTGTKYQRS